MVEEGGLRGNLRLQIPLWSVVHLVIELVIECKWHPVKSRKIKLGKNLLDRKAHLCCKYLTWPLGGI